MSNHTNHYNFRVNGKFAKKTALPTFSVPPVWPPRVQRARRVHTNLFTPLPDSELLKLCPKKFLDLATLLFKEPHKYGYKQHRRLLCTYLQAIENFKRLEGRMGEVFVKRSRFYGTRKVLAKVRQMKVMDLYHLCVVNGIQVPFGTQKWQMLEWLETRCEEGVLLLEPYTEPEDDGEDTSRHAKSKTASNFAPIVQDSEPLSLGDGSGDGGRGESASTTTPGGKNGAQEPAPVRESGKL